MFVGRRGGEQQLYVRRLDAAEARPLAGTEDAQVPAVSPDGQWVAFWAHKWIRKVPLGGGPVVDLTTQAAPPFGLAWDGHGRLLYGHPVSSYSVRIWQIPPDGAPAAVTALDAPGLCHQLPWVLPGDRVMLYTEENRAATWGDEKVVAHTFATGERKVLLDDAADARYVATGHLVFLRRGQLFAVPFDAERLDVLGPAVAVLDGVAQAVTSEWVSDITGAGQFAVAPTGTLGYLPGGVVPYPASTLIAVDRQGRVSALPAPVRSYNTELNLSADGQRLAVTTGSLAERDIWIADLGRGTARPLVTDGESFDPAWSPDGRHVVFGWFKDGRWSLASQGVDAAGPPEIVAAGEIHPSGSWTRDGRRLAAWLGGRAIAMVTVEDGRASVQPVFQTPDTKYSPAVSPDGHWLAWQSSASGREEVYVGRYPNPGSGEQVSLEGGRHAVWRRDGRELFFLSTRDPAGKARMMAIDVEGDHRFGSAARARSSSTIRSAPSTAV